MNTKSCNKCGKEKPLTAFSSQGGRNKHLRRNQCKTCAKKHHQEWVKKNPERVALYRSRDPWSLKRRCDRRNITVEQLFSAFEKQKGKCKICPKSITIENSAIDHNHDTGEFRGLLCKTCNRALGLFKDSPTILTNAAAYLITEGHYGETQDTKVA